MKRTHRLVLALAILLSHPLFAGITDNWFPVPATAQNHMLNNYRPYARMLWAFDYGHALIYEQLWRNAQTGDFDFSLIEGSEEETNSIFARVMKILENPPNQEPAEESLSPQFTTDFSWTMDMFAWSHKLHWVAADVIATEPLPRAKEILKSQLNDVYKKYPSLALPTKCKSMMYFMEGQPFSMRFRRSSPKANGLIWAYHYYQLAIYDALMLPAGATRDKALKDVLKKFQWMAADTENNITEMPLARKVSPNFYREFPELAAIFDNLHEYHDIVGDVLAADDATYSPPKRKKEEMLRTMKDILDVNSHLVDCDKNGHTR